MKKLLLSCALVIFTSLAFGQAHSEGTKNLNIGIGFGGGFATGSQLIPPVSASYEVGIQDNISIGGYLGYTGSEWNFGTGKYKYSYIILGARGAYHLNLDNEKLDAYGGAMLGYYILNAKWDGNGADPGGAGSGSFAYTLFAGARYALSDSFGVFGELGYGISVINLGVNLKM